MIGNMTQIKPALGVFQQRGVKGVSCPGAESGSGKNKGLDFNGILFKNNYRCSSFLFCKESPCVEPGGGRQFILN